MHTQTQVLTVALLALLASAALVAMPRPLVAQEGEPGVYHACYIPRSGIVYRVGEDGLRPQCAAAGHVLFSWNAQGPQGEKGEPGNLALAGRVCSPGQAVVGFDGAGELLCAPVGMNGGNGPDNGEGDPDDESFHATFTWSTAPPITISCGGLSAGSVSTLRTVLRGRGEIIEELDIEVQWPLIPVPLRIPVMLPPDATLASLPGLSVAASTDVDAAVSGVRLVGPIEFSVEVVSLSEMSLELSSNLVLELAGMPQSCSGPEGSFQVTIVDV